MATPNENFKFNPETLKQFIENSKSQTPPVKDFTKPYQIGQRQHHKSPGHRSWSEVWHHPSADTGSNEFMYYDRGYTLTHQGCDFLTHAEFWQEVDMLTGPDADIDELRKAMVHLSAEEVHEGYAHYYDKFIWEDDSDRTRRLMEAFEAEHRDPRFRFDHISQKENFIEKFQILIQNQINESFLIPAEHIEA